MKETHAGEHTKVQVFDIAITEMPTLMKFFKHKADSVTDILTDNSFSAR
jgi:hypothetical protein